MFKISKKRIDLAPEELCFWALLLFLGLVFFMGGSGRADVQSLAILRPASLLFCAIALWSLTWGQVRANGFLFAMALGIFALVLLHLVPLPPLFWNALPGRAIVTEIDTTAGLGQVWRPLSMVPSATLNAFYSLFIPLVVLLLGVQLKRERQFQLLPVVLGLGLLSGFWGLLQAIGDPVGPLYLYRITNSGSAVGLFANRNHQAILLATLFPMLAVFASAGIRTKEQGEVRGWVAIAAGVVLVPLVLVTGSRAGLIVGVMGLLAAATLYRRPRVDVSKKRKVTKVNWRYPIGAFVVLCLGALTVVMSRAEALQRLASPDQVEDQRFLVWGPIASMAWKFFPFGSGIGSFAEVYQIDEPDALLNLNYLNHAHNDWLELYLTAGLPGLLLLLVALAAFARAAVTVFFRQNEITRNVLFGRLAVTVLAIFALGSVGDYPLRTPSLACIFVVTLLWLKSPTKSAGGSCLHWLGREAIEFQGLNN